MPCRVAWTGGTVRGTEMEMLDTPSGDVRGSTVGKAKAEPVNFIGFCFLVFTTRPMGLLRIGPSSLAGSLEGGGGRNGRVKGESAYETRGIRSEPKINQPCEVE